MTGLSLKKELSRKFTKDIGATPFSFGKVGLTHKDLLLNRKLKITENGVVVQCPVWYGEAVGVEGITCILMTVLSDLSTLEDSADELEIVCVIGFKNHFGEFEDESVRIGFLYDWGNEDDPGYISIKMGDQWLPMTLSQRLQFNLGFENGVQEGIVWNPAKNVPETLFENLSEIIEVDEN